MINTILNMETNTRIVSFVLNNLVLIFIIQKTLEYICKKTPWAVDDDLPSFFGGIVNGIKGWKNETGKLPGNKTQD